MNPLSNAYYEGLFQNEKNSRFWEDYLRNLESLDFKQYSNKLTVPVLVPIGSRILFRGELKHTNEVTVALGANYFTKCSTDQAEILKLHRIKVARSNLESLQKERKYLEDQLSFNKKNVFEDSGKDIVEYQTEEEDEHWRKKHRENMRQYKQSQAKVPNQVENEVSDEELWNRLEELELQEELEEELLSMKGENTDHSINILDNRKTFIGYEEEAIIKQIERKKFEAFTVRTEVVNTNNVTQDQTSKIELLKKVLDKQNELSERLSEIKNKERSKSRTEQDVLSRLDEMEQLDELEDEMNRLDDVLLEDSEELNNTSMSAQPREKLKRNVAFEDEDDSETLELEFTHSPEEPSKELYNLETGITKPSDIYEAYPHLFTSTTSILKQTNYNTKKYKSNVNTILQSDNKTLELSKDDKGLVNSDINKTIVIQDIAEKVSEASERIECKDNTKPISLFKQRRQQKK